MPEGTRVIDLSSYTLLPGLIDTHVHITSHFRESGGERLSEAYWAAKNAACLLDSGFTTVRSLGSRSEADLKLRDAIRRGLVPGPRLLVSGRTLKAEWRASWRESQIRNFVRSRITKKVDWLKVFATESIRKGGDPTFSEKEVRWAVQEAALQNVPVAAHAHSAEGAKRAILAGVRSLEHGALLDDEALQLLADRNVFYVPNLYICEYYLNHWTKFSFDAEARDWTEKGLALQKKVFRRSVEMRIKILFGSDAVAGWMSSGATAIEFQRRVAAGQQPKDALISATGLAAEALQMGDKIGDLELLSIGVEKHQAAFSSGTWLTGTPLTYLAPW